MNGVKIEKIAKELCEKSPCHHKCHDTKGCVVEDEAEAIYSELTLTLKQALWEIVRDENIIITNQNIDWLLDRAEKRANDNINKNNLKDSILERKAKLDKLGEPELLINENKSNNFEVKSNNSTQNQLTNSKLQVEEMCRLICNACEFGCGFEGGCDGGYDYKKCNNAIETALALYNADYRKQSEGEWIIDRTPIDATFKCSKCGYSYIEADPQAETEYKFCPNCGAKMKGGAE